MFLNLAKPKLGEGESAVRKGTAWGLLETHPLQAPVAVSMIALLCSTSPKREA